MHATTFTNRHMVALYQVLTSHVPVIIYSSFPLTAGTLSPLKILNTEISKGEFVMVRLPSYDILYFNARIHTLAYISPIRFGVMVLLGK